MQEPRKIKVGIVGFGMSARVFHAPLIDSNPFFQLYAFVERNNNLAEKKYAGVKTYRSLTDLCADVEVDLVVITTPSSSHYLNCKEVILAGKHCIVEKPFTVHSSEAEELAELAFENDVLLSVFHNRRWDGDFLTVKEICEKKLIGSVVEYEAHFDRFRNSVRKNAWREHNVPGSGILYDLGSHLVDQAIELFGVPEAVSADVRTQREGAQVDDYFQIELLYSASRNLKVTLKAGMLVREPGPKFLVHGTHGSYVKYGMDPQEAALKAGHTPHSMDFEWGREPEEKWGVLNTDIKGIHFKGKVETIPGRYQEYYNNIAHSLNTPSMPYDLHKLKVKAAQAARVISILELALESSSKKERMPIYK
eukprot:Nk52_evm87s62 gene=Nk52_evmTU87s62